MIAKPITYFGKNVILVCDGQCHKAWGNSQRPRTALSHPQDDDNFAFLSDGELEEAPIDPGTYEGRDGKPRDLRDRLNKWCARECERSVIIRANEDFSLPDLSIRRFNIAGK